MAAGDGEIKKLLVKLGIDTTDARAAVKEIYDLVNKGNKDSSAAIATQRQQQQITLGDIRLQQEAQKTVTLETMNAVKAAQAKAAETRAETAEIQRQIAMIRLKNAEEAKGSKEKGEGGLGGAIGSGLQTVARAAGGGILGNVFAGTLAGAGTVAGIEAVSEGIAHLVEEFEKLVTMSGPLQEAENTFNTLTAKAGINSTEFAGQLSNATHGLVSMKQIYSDTNRVLLSGAGLTQKQIIKLTATVTDYTRAQGHDVPAAMEQMYASLARGRLGMLGYQLGLDAATSEQLRFEQRLPVSQRLLAQFNTLITGMSAKLKESGTPALTLTEEITRLSLGFDLLVEKTAIALTKTGAFGDFLKYLDDLFSKNIDKVDGLADSIATNLGLAFGVVVEAARGLRQILDDILGSFGKLTGDTGFKGFMIDLSKTIVVLTAGIRELIGDITDIMTVASALLHPEDTIEKNIGKLAAPGIKQKMASGVLNTEQLKSTTESRDERNARIENDMNERLNDIDVAAVDKKEHPALIGGGSRTSPSSDIDPKGDQARLTTFKDQLAENEALVKASLDRIREDTEQSYQSGLTDYDAYLQKKIDLANIQLAQQLDIAQKTAAADTKFNAPENPVNIGKGTEELKEKDKQIAIQKQTAIDKATDEHQRALDAVERERVKQNQADAATSIRYEAAAEKAKTKLASDMLEQQHHDGLISEQRYLEQRDDLIRQDARTQIKEVTASYIGTPQSHQKDTELAAKKVEIQQTADDKIEENHKNAIDAMIADEKRLHELQLGFYADNDSEAGLRARLKILQEWQATNVKVLSDTNALGKVGADAWGGALDSLTKTRQEINTIQGELKQFETSAVIGAAANTLSGLFGGISFPGAASRSMLAKGPAAISDALGYGGKIIGAETAFTKNVTADKDAEYSSRHITPEGGVFGQLEGAFKNLITGTGTFSSRLDRVNKVLTDAAPAIVAFMDAFTKPVGGTAGAMAGAVAGGSALGGIGDAVSSATGATGEAASILGDMGPIGAIAGGVLGGLLGQARADMEKVAQTMQQNFSLIMNQMQDQTITTAQGLQQLQATRQETIDQLSGMKGGQQQIQQIVPQMDQQIQALQFQIQQTAIQLSEAVGTLTNPEAFSSLYSSLDQIISQYKTYVQTATDAAQAQDFLNDSIQRFAYDTQNQLNQAEETAVQDAINYNDLLVQRQELLNQIANTQYDAITNGVLGRERTASQMALQQAAQSAQDQQIQLQQINEQVAAAQFRVQAEQQIFGIATDRISLEMQLLALQNQQTTLQMQSIQAMQQLVNAAGPNATAQALMAFLAQAGVPASLQQLVATAFQTYGSYAYTNIQSQ